MRNRIKDIVKEQMITPETMMIMINGAYFRSKWSKPFNKDFTQPGFFYQSTNSYMRTNFMMSKTLIASAVIEDLGSTLGSLPFIVKDHRMLLFFQNSRNKSISELEYGLFKDSKLQIKKYLGQLKYRNTELAIPKFEAGSSLNLSNFLESLGVSDIFDN